MEQCDPEGPVCIFVSKIIPFKEGTKAFGRIFSGTIRKGEKMKVFVSDTDKGTVKNVTSIGVCMSNKFLSVGSMPCGNTVVLGGVEQAILKEATIVSNGVNSMTFKHMKFAVAPVVEIAVKAKKPNDREKLVKALKRLSQADPLVKVSINENGESIVAGAGDLHIKICESQLKKMVGDAEIVCSEPTVSYRETCVGDSEPMLAKTSNKLNRLLAECSPLGKTLTKEIEESDLLKLKKE
jgi:elongation factor 2